MSRVQLFSGISHMDPPRVCDQTNSSTLLQLSTLEEALAGHFVNQIASDECDHVSETFEPFYFGMRNNCGCVSGLRACGPEHARL